MPILPRRAACTRKVARAGAPLALLAALALPQSTARAATLIPPRSLGDLALASDAVVLAEALSSEVLRKGVLLTTRSELVVLSALSGPLAPGDVVAVEVPGGEAGGEVWAVPGAPRFHAGRAYLLCLERGADGAWLPRTLAFGVLEEAAGADGSALLAPVPEATGIEPLPRFDGEAVEPIVPCRRDALLEHLRAVLVGEAGWDSSGLRASAEVLPEKGGGGAVPAGCVYFEQDGRNFRWQTFDSGGTAVMGADSRGDASMAGGGFRQVQDGMNLWMGISGSSVNLVYGGPADVTIDCAAGGAARGGLIMFNDPCSEMGGGILAFGGPTAAGFHAFDGASWWTINGWIVVVNDGAGSLGATNYARMLAHELGHGLGYGHYEDTGALMFGTCCNGINATDTRCARYTYPSSDPQNQRPQVGAGGDRTLVLAGNTALLAGTASDDGRPAGGTLTTRWSQVGGPGTVSFGDPAALETSAVFSRSGTYLLALTASDGRLIAVDVAEATVQVDSGSVATAAFQQGVAGYSGTADTELAEGDPSGDSSGAADLRADSESPAGSGLEFQILLRFDGVFGDRAGQVPPGASIRTAWLELATSNDGDGARLHRMVADWDAASGWAAYGGDGIQAGREAEAAPDAIAAGAPGTVRVDVTASLAAWSLDPCSNHGWALLPAGDDGWVFSSSEGATPPRLVVEHSVVPSEKLVRLGDRWSYFKGTRDPPSDWSLPGFAPGAGWLSGPTGIGYGDGDDATVLADMRSNYASVFCRRELDVPELSAVGRLLLRIDYDDGYVAYLNGVEAARSASMGAPGSPVARGTLAQSRDAGSAEERFLDPSLLVPGKNVLAIEVHNAALDSSDLSLLPELEAQGFLIAPEAPWRFLKGSAAVPAGWAGTDFDDAAWDEGPLGLGYGDGDDFTVLEDMRGGYLSVFLRKELTLADPAALGSPRLTVIYDDGVVVYWNGAEVARRNMPAGPAGPGTAASSSIEATAASFDLPAGRLRAGKNVVAISVHNASLDSSDLTLAAVVVPAGGAARSVSCDGGFQRGDASADGSIDIADAVRILLHLFAGLDRLDCPDGGDVDDDGSLRLTDAVSLLNYLFRGGPRPAAPGPDCGDDPTPDALGECSSPACGG